MENCREEWRFMRLRAQQLYEEGEVRKALRMMWLINEEQEEWFRAKTDEEKKIVSTR